MGSGSELGTCANIIRAILVIINILFGILGVIVFAIGIWAIVEDQNYSFVTGNGIVSGAAILIAAGIITFIICVIGILGAIFKLRPLLIVYALAVFIIVVLEIVAGIVAFVFRGDVIDEINDRSLEALRLYRVAEDAVDYREDVNDFVTFVQDALDCCGVNNASDWFEQNPVAVNGSGPGLPVCPACDEDERDDCMTFTDEFGRSFVTVPDGCRAGSSDRLTVFLYAVGGVGIAFGILEVVGILFAVFLCCCIQSALKQEVV